MHLVTTGLDFTSVSRIVRVPQGPAGTGNEETTDANAPQSCSLPLGFFAGSTEGGIEGLFHSRMSAPGFNNHVLEAAVKAGMRYHNGKIYFPFVPAIPTKISTKGYRTIRLDGKTFNLARVVCWLVHGPPPSPSHYADHINRRKLDDSPGNLRWVTASESNRNICPIARKKHNERIKVCTTGRFKPSKLTISKVNQIRKSPLNHVMAAEKFGVSRWQVSLIRRNLRWKTPEPLQS
jgi:hypothetical protein